MSNLTPDGQQLVNNLSTKYNLSQAAVTHLLTAVNNGQGTQAQFNCPELGGQGQWMRGGMTMVGDMFNHGLKMTVDNLCTELANGLALSQVFVKAAGGGYANNQWWPENLGQPSSSGAQNNSRYAVFSRHLAVEANGQVRVYDTLDHRISGVSQQQGSDNSLQFNSQYGTLAVNSLPLASSQGSFNQSASHQEQQNNFIAPRPYPAPDKMQQNSSTQSQQSSAPQNSSTQSQQSSAPQNSSAPISTLSSADEIIQLIEKLAKLKASGAISEDEYLAKKTDLLNRI